MKNTTKFHAACLTAAMLLGSMLPLAAYAETDSAAETEPDAPSYIRAADLLETDEEGRVSCAEDGERKTGRFTLTPNYLVGDLDGNGEVDSSDASLLLEAAAAAGSSEVTAAEHLAEAEPEHLANADAAAAFADADTDGAIDSTDAAAILTYSAELGAGTEVLPLGSASYFADADGYLQKGFFTDGETGNTFYADEQYRLCSGWLDLEGKRFYLDAQTGLLPEGWQTVNDKQYLMQEDGSITQNAWAERSGGLFYLNEKGDAETGLVEIDGAAYFIAEDIGRITGWFELGGERCWFDENGVRQSGFCTIDESTYYFDEDGALQRGFREIDGNTYYFRPETGEMVTGVAALETGGRGWFGENGVLQTGWFEAEGSLHYSDGNGMLLTGIQHIDGNIYYFSANTLNMAVNVWVKQTDGWRYFTENGTALTDGLQEIEGSIYLLDEDGLRQTGWQEVNGVRCWFDESTGARASGLTTLSDGTYLFAEDGSVMTGWQTLGGNRYYFNESGIMLKNQTVDGMYLDENGRAVSALYYTNKQRAQTAFAKNGKTVSGIYSYVRSTTHYKYIESTRTLAQIEAKGWLYYVDYSMTHYYGVCYYLAAKMDFLLTEAGYECRIVHATHGSGDHYWNQVKINGSWINYDCTNGYNGYSWNSIIAAGNYTFLGYVRPVYK